MHDIKNEPVQFLEKWRLAWRRNQNRSHNEDTAAEKMATNDVNARLKFPNNEASAAMTPGDEKWLLWEIDFNVHFDNPPPPPAGESHSQLSSRLRPRQDAEWVRPRFSRVRGRPKVVNIIGRAVDLPRQG